MNVLSHCTEERSSRYLETSGNDLQITGCHITEGTILQSYCHDTLRTHMEASLSHIIHVHRRLCRLKSGLLFYKSWMVSLIWMIKLACTFYASKCKTVTAVQQISAASVMWCCVVWKKVTNISGESISNRFPWDKYLWKYLVLILKRSWRCHWDKDITPSDVSNKKVMVMYSLFVHSTWSEVSSLEYLCHVLVC